MSLITWTQTFRDANAATGTVPLRNAAVSVYLAGTTNAASILDHATIRRTAAPQVYTDIAGYIEISIDTDDYPTNQSFDIVAVPDPNLNPDTETIKLTGVQFIRDSGKIKDQIDLFVFDPELGYLQWETWGRIKKGAAARLTLDDPSNSAASILDLGGAPSGNTFGYVYMAAQTSLTTYINGLISMVMTDTYWKPETNNVIALGQAAAKFSDIYSCNAVTVAACSPAPPVAIDQESSDLIIEEIKGIQAWADDKGTIIIGDHGYPQVDMRSLPTWASNKADLYREIRQGSIRKLDLQKKLSETETIRLAVTDIKEAEELDQEIQVIQREISLIPYEPKPEVYWEDFCAQWDKGEYQYKGAGQKMDPGSLAAISALIKKIETLESEIQAMKEAKPA
jgi:hypothetical protein